MSEWEMGPRYPLGALSHDSDSGANCVAWSWHRRAIIEMWLQLERERVDKLRMFYAWRFTSSLLVQLANVAG
jgi:hypothetical protein